MKKARRTEEQIIGILQEHEAGAKCADLCRKHGMSEGTFYAWKAKYSGMTVSEAKRLKALEDENARLKRLLAEQMLDIIDADPDYNVMTMTHDEIVVICPDEKVDTCLDDMLRIMRTPPTWAPDLPLDAEGGYAQDYSK